MTNSSSFKIFNASAGSGKTYTLVKEYLKILFRSDSVFKYRQILAMTFTNKAVGEMKERIIDSLIYFSNEKVLENPNSLFIELCNELSLEKKHLILKSKNILRAILNEYGTFEISTIDRFNHKIIRTFARDLNIPQNFEVELDTDTLLNLAVDNMISKTGLDKDLTAILIDFAIEKTDDDKSWDISLDLKNIAKLLTNENHVSHLYNLESKSLNDFKALKKTVIEKAIVLEQKIIDKSQSVLNLMEASGLQFNNFSGSYLPKHFKNLVDKKFNIKFENKWQQEIASKPLFPKTKTTPEIASIINEIQPQLSSVFHETKEDVFHLKLLKNIYRNLTPLSVLKAIQKELNQIKEDQNILLISEFNSIISNEIKNQPSPFIYERIGEKFKHYFIDEFQDTSELQWTNLKPLIENTLSSENGTAMLVGDAKQAIYRWRGGKPEQFIDLFNKKEKPFTVSQFVDDLPKNFRSSKQIVHFNNDFFKYLSESFFNNPSYASIYSQCHQRATNEFDGLVDISFLDIDKEEEKNEVYCQKVLETVKVVLKNGYQLKDICILVRKRAEGMAVADLLTQNNIQIISSETLLLNRSPKVRFVVNMMQLAVQPNNNEVKVEILNFLADLKGTYDRHNYFKSLINLNPSELFNNFKEFDFNIFIQISFYDAIEYLLRAFNLINTADAYIQFFLDEVLSFTISKQASFVNFLSFWEEKREKLSIVSKEGLDAVHVMTIHKAKGLEFPVVIFPFADLDIYREKDTRKWIKVDPEYYSGFSEMLINLNKDVEAYNKTGSDLYTKHQFELELDNINLLYVTLTRAIEQLYVIGKKNITSKGVVNNRTYSGLLINYLKAINLWENNKLNYVFGSYSNPNIKKEDAIHSVIQKDFISSNAISHNINIITNSSLLWDTSKKQSIERGNLIHHVMSKIKTESDIEFVLQDLINSGTIAKLQKEELHQTILNIVTHPKLKEFYSANYRIYNERDILTEDGQVHRPDRIVIDKENRVVIIDYKTGNPAPQNVNQLNIYQDSLKSIGFKVSAKLLVYINKNITVVEC